MEIKLAESIRRLRRDAGLTQEQLAEALGVTTGAVHKWESGKATPELGLLVEIAAFFETSIDAMLDYGWQTQSMGQAVEKLKRFTTEKRLEDGMEFAQRVLQKYPNSFDIVFHSADLYFLAMEPACARTAIELYQRALTLLNQNTDRTISTLVIQNKIAMCYCYMGRDDKAIELLKDNNADGGNDFRIGLLLSKEPEQAQEALLYLSEALVRCHSQLYNLCIGYANAYLAQRNIDGAADFVQWMYDLGKGLWDPSAVTCRDRGDVGLCLILAYADACRDDRSGALRWLAQARDHAHRFDTNPEHRIHVGMKFYHGRTSATAYDDMGETAMSIIKNHLADEELGPVLRPLWDALCAADDERK